MWRMAILPQTVHTRYRMMERWTSNSSVAVLARVYFSRSFLQDLFGRVSERVDTEKLIHLGSRYIHLQKTLLHCIGM